MLMLISYPHVGDHWLRLPAKISSMKALVMYPATPRVPAYALQSLLAYLEKEYCAPIERISKKISDCIAEIHGGDVHQSASLYTTLSTKLVEQAGLYIGLHRRSLRPYLEELIRKEEAGGDCRLCSVTCSERHSTQLTEIQEVHIQLHETLDQLRAIVEPLQHETSYPDSERNLRREVKRLDEYVSELIYLEETAIIPMIIEAQNVIHANGR